MAARDNPASFNTLAASPFDQSSTSSLFINSKVCEGVTVWLRRAQLS